MQWNLLQTKMFCKCYKNYITLESTSVMTLNSASDFSLRNLEKSNIRKPRLIIFSLFSYVYLV